MAELFLTDEQRKILATDPVAGKPIKVTAFAGTGKTFTLTQYAKSRMNQQMIYIAYNKSIQLHAEKVMPPTVISKTIHSLAFAKFGKKYKDKLGNLKVGSVMRHLNVREYKFAMFITRTLEAYLASSLDDIDERCIPRGAERVFGKGVNSAIVTMANRVWDACREQDSTDMIMPHDGYLKLYQLSRPQINTGVVLMDEAQDTTPCVWDIIMKQKAPKIVVGDPNQEIYQFRGSICAMDQVLPEPDRDLPLTQSFRFGPVLAQEASILLKTLKGEKRVLRGNESLKTQVRVCEETTKAPKSLLLCRGNSLIFEEAFDAAEHGTVGFIGGSSGYRLDMYLDGMNLKFGSKSSIVNPLLKAFNTFDEFAEFAEATEDVELAGVVRAVDKYGTGISSRVSKIRACEAEPLNADYIFSTVHKAKGLEWPSVILGEDLARIIKAHLDNPDDHRYPDEEANLLYVALTRGIQSVTMQRTVSEFIRSGRKPPTKKKKDETVRIRNLKSMQELEDLAEQAEQDVVAMESEYDLADYD